MPYPKEYMFNASVKYSVPAVQFNNDLSYKNKLLDLLTNVNIYVTDRDYFKTKLENIFTNTIITFKNTDEVN